MYKMASNRCTNRSHHLLLLIMVSAVLGHALGQVKPILAVGGSNSGGQQASETSATSTQPLWSYQVKPTNYVNTQAGQQQHYTTAASTIFDAFQGLSQRQGALSGSPFLSILPIILIAAGGFMLLLPLLTMMMASPFGGAFGGGYNGANGFGYPPQFSKKRSLNASLGDPSFAGSRTSLDLIEHVSNAIEELARKYSPAVMTAANNQQPTSASKRGKSMSFDAVAPATGAPGNHRQAASGNLNENQSNSNVVNNNSST